MEDFHPPQHPVHRRAIGLPPAFTQGSASIVILRMDSLPADLARVVSAAAKDLGGVPHRLAPGNSPVGLLLELPSGRWNAFLSRLGETSIPGPLLRDLRSASKASRGSFRPLKLRDRSLALSGRTLIQGILNITPDSFYDAGRCRTPSQAVRRVQQMVKEGADFVDVGGESTRPSAQPISAREEIRRVLPVIEALAGRIPVPLSVDTTKVEVAQAALHAGAEMINDISGLKFEPRLGEVAARHGAAVILSHIRGRPGSMQRNPRYRHLLPEIVASLQASVRRAEQAGVCRDSILVDPGIGFGKTAAHNLLLLRYLPALHSTGRPILVGASRKSFLGKILGLGAQRLLHGSLAVAAIAVYGGAAALRVHDVAASVEAARVAEAVRDATMTRPDGG
jgi:dihydropteroate synthase